MDISLNQALENSDKHQDNLSEDSSNDLVRADGQTQMTGNSQHPGLYFRQSDNGQVTYRVVQVGGSENNQQATLSIVSTNGIQNILSPGAPENATPQVAIVANSFNDSGESSSSNTVTENQGAKFAYFAQSAAPSSNTGQEVTTQADQSVAQGQFYVMMSPQDMIPSSQSKHQLAPKNQFSIQKLDASNATAVVRDSNRRVQHNEVERRRRDKINNWIMKLSKLVPDCAGDHSKQGQSKGGILAKTCEYILLLQNTQQQYLDSIKEMEGLQEELNETRMQLEQKQQENAILHQALRSHGIAVDIKSTSNM